MARAAAAVGAGQPLERIYADTPERLRQALAPWYRRPPAELGFDLETTSLDPRAGRILLASLSDGSRTVVAHHRANLAQLRPLLQYPQTRVVAHNARFEFAWMAEHYATRTQPLWDTLLADQVLRCGQPDMHDSSLADLARRYLGRTVDKALQTSFADVDPDTFEPTDEQLDYAALDAEIVLPLKRHLAHRLKLADLGPTLELECQLIPAIAAMERVGMPVEREAWAALIADLAARLAEQEQALVERLTPPIVAVRLREYAAAAQARAEWEARYAEQKEAWEVGIDARVEPFESKRERRDAINAALKEWKEANPPPPRPKIADGPINLASPAQLLAAFHELGLAVEDTASQTLQDALKSFPAQRELLEEFLEWRGLHKLQTAFGQAVLDRVGEDGRLRPEINQLVSTGRVSMRRPNLQQIPAGKRGGPVAEIAKRFRQCFVAPPGRTFVVADYSAIEFRIMADMANEAWLIEAFRRGEDAHQRSAARMYEMPFEACAKGGANDRLREGAKTINYGIAYGMLTHTLAERLNCSEPEAREKLERWRAAHAGVAALVERLGKQAVERGYARTLNGRRRLFELPPRPSRRDPQALREWARIARSVERQGKNAPIQGTSADITKWALVLIERELQAVPDAALLLTVHDEIVCECNEGDGERVAEIVARCMVAAGERWLKRVPVEVDVHLGRDWTH